MPQGKSQAGKKDYFHHQFCHPMEQRFLVLIFYFHLLNIFLIRDHKDVVLAVLEGFAGDTCMGADTVDR